MWLIFTVKTTMGFLKLSSNDLVPYLSFLGEKDDL